jgi:hypothetical protein
LGRLWTLAASSALIASGASCRTSDWTFSDLDVAGSEAQGYIAQAKESPLRVPGLSEPPSAGKLSKGTPRRPGAGQWDPSVAFSVSWKSGKRTAAWDFQMREGRAVLVCWSEQQHSRRVVSSPFVNKGQQFYEHLMITSGTGGSCGYEGGFAVRHWSAAGIQTIPLASVPNIVASWAE